MKVINAAGQIIWNGPTGMPYQVEPFTFQPGLNYLNSVATRAFAKAIMEEIAILRFRLVVKRTRSNGESRSQEKNK